MQEALGTGASALVQGQRDIDDLPLSREGSDRDGPPGQQVDPEEAVLAARLQRGNGGCRDRKVLSA